MLFVALLCQLLTKGQSTDPGPSQLGPALQLERETRWLSARVLQVGYPGAEVTASFLPTTMTQANPAPLQKHAAQRCILQFLLHGAFYYRSRLLRSLGELTPSYGSDSAQRESEIIKAAILQSGLHLAQADSVAGDTPVSTILLITDQDAREPTFKLCDHARQTRSHGRGSQRKRGRGRLKELQRRGESPQSLSGSITPYGRSHHQPPPFSSDLALRPLEAGHQTQDRHCSVGGNAKLHAWHSEGTASCGSRGPRFVSAICGFGGICGRTDQYFSIPSSMEICRIPYEDHRELQRNRHDGLSTGDYKEDRLLHPCGSTSSTSNARHTREVRDVPTPGNRRRMPAKRSGTFASSSRLQEEGKDTKGKRGQDQGRRRMKNLGTSTS
jgi:hypothetical protein